MKPDLHRSVSKLTLPLWDRQSYDALLTENERPTSRLLIAAVIVVFFAIGTDTIAAQAWQPIDDIAAAAESYLRGRSGDTAGSTRGQLSAGRE